MSDRRDGPFAPLALAALLLLGLGLTHALTAPDPRLLGRLEVPVVTEAFGEESPERLAAIRYGQRFALDRPSAIDVGVRGALPVDLDLALVADDGAVMQLREYVSTPTTLTLDALHEGSWSVRALALGPREGQILLEATLPSRSPWLLPLAMLLALPGLGLATIRARRDHRLMSAARGDTAGPRR